MTPKRIFGNVRSGASQRALYAIAAAGLIIAQGLSLPAIGGVAPALNPESPAFSVSSDPIAFRSDSTAINPPVAAPTPAAAPEQDANWLAKAQKGLAEREYHASDNGKGLQAPNRKHNLRT